MNRKLDFTKQHQKPLELYGAADFVLFFIPRNSFPRFFVIFVVEFATLAPAVKLIVKNPRKNREEAETLARFVIYGVKDEGVSYICQKLSKSNNRHRHGSMQRQACQNFETLQRKPSRIVFTCAGSDARCAQPIKSKNPSLKVVLKLQIKGCLQTSIFGDDESLENGKHL